MTEPAWPPGGWDDSLHGAVACTEAVIREDYVALRTVLRYGNHAGMLVVLAKLLAELLDDCGAEPAEFREWAPQAVSRRPR